METTACAQIDGPRAAWLGRDHVACIEIATALVDPWHTLVKYLLGISGVYPIAQDTCISSRSKIYLLDTYLIRYVSTGYVLDTASE